MTSRDDAPARLVASHLRDFAEFLPVEKREDFNATIDDLVDRLATAYEANTALDRALRSDTAPLYPKSENSRDIAPMVQQTIREKSSATSAGCVSVPIEPTPEMCAAAQTAEHGKQIGTMGWGHYAKLYRAMLAAAPVAADTKTPKSHDDLLRKKPVLVDQHGNDIYPPKLCNWIEDACRLLRGAPLLDERPDSQEKP